MKRPTHRRGNQANPLRSAMTPMIDVVFLLLVFFLCTATFVTPEEDLAASLLVESTPAGAGSDPAEPLELEEVSLFGAHRGDSTVWTVNNGVQTTAGPELVRLLSELASIDRGLPVTIDSDGTPPVGDVVAAYDAAREAGFGRVRLAASAETLEALEPAP